MASTIHFEILIIIAKLATLYMQVSAVVAIRNILEKPEDSLNRDPVFTDSTFDNPNMKK